MFLVTRRVFVVVIVAIVLTTFVSIVEAGQCSGVVVYSDGSKAAKVKISGYVSGGGSTKDFYTDSSGNFTLTWSSSAGLDKIYVKGSTAATNIANGATGLRVVVP